MDVEFEDTLYQFPEGTDLETVKKYLREKVLQLEPEPVEPEPPKPEPMDPGFYKRDDGTYFEITASNEVVEHGS